MKFKNLTLIGTNHIAKESVKQVNEIITNESPDIIALELDKPRLQALLTKKKQKKGRIKIRKIGIKGYLFSLMGGWAEKKLGEYVGVSPGSEMKEAAKLAQIKKIPLALIDQEIEITLRRFSNELTWGEKWNFIVDLLKAFIFRKKEVEFDISKVPDQETINLIISKVRKRYPNVVKVLIDERNEIMAKRLARLIKLNPEKKIVGIIGAGHEKEIIEMIKEELKMSVSYSFTIN